MIVEVYSDTNLNGLASCYHCTSTALVSYSVNEYMQLCNTNFLFSLTEANKCHIISYIT